MSALLTRSAQASKLRIELRSCKVLPVLETVFEVLSAAAGEKGVDLAYEIEGEEAYRTLRSCLLVSDPQRLQQVLMNLMSNAIKVACPVVALRLTPLSVHHPRTRPADRLGDRVRRRGCAGAP